MGLAPTVPGAASMGAGMPPAGGDNQVRIQFKPSGQQSLTMSVDSQKGAFDVQINLQTGVGMLLDLAKCLGQMAGVPVDQMMAEIAGGIPGGPGGGGPGGGPPGGGDMMGGAPPGAGPGGPPGMPPEGPEMGGLSQLASAGG